MNVEPVLLALQAAFLVLLYVFIWRVVRSAGRDMQVAPQESFILAPSQLAAEHQVSDPGRLVVERSKAIAGREGVRCRAGARHRSAAPAKTRSLSTATSSRPAHHARIESQRDGVWVLDLGSTNGTFVNGERVEGRRQLHRGDLVQIGDTELRFER